MQTQPTPQYSVTLPVLTLMLTLALLPLLDAGFDHQVRYWVLFLLLAVSMLLSAREKWQVHLDLKEPLLWYALFVLWAAISIAWSINPHRTLVEFLEISCYGLVFFLALRLDEDSIFRVGRIALIAGVGVALFGISQYLFLSSSRIQATFTNANPLGIYLAMLFFLGWAYYLRRPNRLLAAGCVMLLVALALSGSRGAFICFFLALPLIFYGFKGKEFYTGIIKSALCLAVALLITQCVMMAAPYLQETVGRQRELAAFLTRPESFVTTSGMGRLAFWEVGGRLALLEPLKGHGLGTYHLAYYLEYLGDRWYARFAHNHYLQVLVELGLVGFGLLVGFVITVGRRTWQRVKQGGLPVYFSGILAAMVAFLLHIGGDFSWNFPAAAVLFFAAAGAATGTVMSREKALIELNYKHLLGLLTVLFLLTAWQFSVTQMYSQGVELDARGEIAAAANVYEQANSIYPINSMSHSFASNNYLQLAREQEDPEFLEKALVSAQKAVQLSPVDGNLHNNLGKLYWEVGDLEKAERHLALAVEYAAYRLNMFLDLGWFYLQQDRSQQAEDVFLQALELEEAALSSARGEDGLERVESQLLNLHVLLARIYQDSGREELADEYMLQASYINPNHSAVLDYFQGER